MSMISRTLFVGVFALSSLAYAEPVPKQPPVKAGPFAAEAELNAAVWVVDEGFASFEDAKKALPGIVLKARFVMGKEAPKKIPAHVLKDPKSEETVAHYQTFARTVLFNPWMLHTGNKKWNGTEFLLLTANGDLLKGKLPVEFSDTVPGKFENRVTFVDPATKKTSFLNLEHELAFEKDEAAGTSSRVESSEVIPGELEPFKGKYTKIEVEELKADDYRNVVHDRMASEMRVFFSRLKFPQKDKEVKPAVAKFLLATGRKIEKPEAGLKAALDDIEKEIANK